MENKNEDKKGCGRWDWSSHSKCCMLKVVLVLLIVFMLGVFVGKCFDDHHHKSYHKRGWHDMHYGGYMIKKDAYRYKTMKHGDRYHHRDWVDRPAYHSDGSAYYTPEESARKASDGVSNLETQ